MEKQFKTACPYYDYIDEALDRVEIDLIKQKELVRETQNPYDNSLLCDMYEFQREYIVLLAQRDAEYNRWNYERRLDFDANNK